MEIYRNKHTGQWFIYIEEISQDKARFVTPHCEIKELELRLFDKPEEYSISQGRVTKKLVEKYHEYIERMKERKARLEKDGAIKDMTDIAEKAKKMTPEELRKAMENPLKILFKHKKEDT